MPYLRYIINLINAFLHNYETLKSLAEILIYIQIGCSLIGSLNVMYNHMSLINLGTALVGSSAIAMNSRGLTRAYAVLLFFTVLVDVSWFVYSWYLESTTLFLFIILVRMEIVGFCVRFLLCMVWIQMYILEMEGISRVATSSRSKNDSDDDLGYSISDCDDANSSGDEDQQHNHLLSKQEVLENEVQRLEMYKAQLLESIERKKRDVEQKKALNLQLKALKRQMDKTKKVPKNSSNLSTTSVSLASSKL